MLILVRTIVNMVVDSENRSITSHVLPHDHVQETLVLNPQLIYHSNEEFALYGYCIPVFAALSLVANSLVIRTLGFRRPHGEQPPNLSSLDLLLQHLATYDIAVAGLRWFPTCSPSCTCQS